MSFKISVMLRMFVFYIVAEAVALASSNSESFSYFCIYNGNTACNFRADG
jgi:hypothetical protein